MDSDELCWMSATTLAASIRRRRVSPVEVVEAVLRRLERLNPVLNAYVTVTAEEARRAARAAERVVMRRSARPGPLIGVPFSVKDLVITKGVRTTFGTPLFRDHIPAEDAPVVTRLKAAGAILLGKTNTPTLGWVGITDNLLFGATRNPWDLGCTPGGSSGGAAAAVAAGLGPLAVGTDGGGSIRKPAAFCGIVGMKPSYGRWPVYPHGGAWSLSHVGPMTRTVADAALMMNVCAGPDERDPCSLPTERVDYVRALRGPVRGIRVAYSDTLGLAPAVDGEVRARGAEAVRALRAAGCRVEVVELAWPSAWEAWRVIFLGGLAARLAPFLDRRDEIDPALRPAIEEMLRMSPTRYVQAWFDRLMWAQHPRALFERYDVLACPTVATAAFPLGILWPTEIDGRPVDREAGSAFTYPFNLTGQPAISVPCGFTSAGLPVGLQLVGRRFDDLTVLRVAAAFERVQPWAHRRPPDVEAAVAPVATRAR